MKFNEVFHEIISSADAKSKKPQQEFFSFIYKEIKQKYHFKKEDVVFWDDIEKNVTAGNEFGFQSFQSKTQTVMHPCAIATPKAMEKRYG